ncbi:MAG TPA: hypothetical protein VF595_13180 [Tepidisphaeraceae bacterium]
MARTAFLSVSLSIPLALGLTFCPIATAQLLPPGAQRTPPALPPASAPTSQPADVAAIRKALSDYNAAVVKGDAEVLKSFVVVTTDVQKRAMNLMGRLTTSGRTVYDAAMQKYGQAEMTKSQVERLSFPNGFPALPEDGLDIQPSGDKAMLINRLAAEAPPLGMMRMDGGWKIDGNALLPPLTEKQFNDQMTVLNAAIDAIDQTTADINAGHFRTPDEAVTIMNLRVQKGVRAEQAKLVPLEGPTTGPTPPPLPVR